MFHLSNSVLLVLTLIALVGIIVLGTKTKYNVGVFAIIATWIIYCFLGGEKTSTLISYFPAKNFYVFIAPAFFFGYANQNGTLPVLADHIVYATRKHPWFYPFIAPILGFTLTALGCSSTPTALITGTICFALAAKSGFNPILVSIGIACGTTACGVMPSNVVFNAKRTYLSPFTAEENIFQLCLNSGLVGLIMSLIFFLLLYAVLKGWKARKLDDFQKPEKLSPVQRKTAILILVVMALVLVPVILKLIFPKSAAIKAIASFCDIQFLAFAGVIACMLMKLGDDKAVMARLPWGIILLSGGFYTMLSAANNAGLPDVLANAIPASIPGVVIMMIIFCFGGILSFFTGAYNCWLILLPIAYAALANDPSINESMAVTAATVGALITSASPFSTCGAGVMAATPEDLRETLFMKQFIVTLIMMVFTALLCLTPLGGSMFSL